MPFVDRDRALGGHAVGDEHLADGFGRGDEAVDLPLLPSRERVAAQVKVDAARRDERPVTRPPVAADAAPIDNASAAIATPCASCAWMMSGRAA